MSFHLTNYLSDILSDCFADFNRYFFLCPISPVLTCHNRATIYEPIGANALSPC